MHTLKRYCCLLRVQHYVKNFLILFPLFFGQALFHVPLLCRVLLGTASFCFLSSAVYIFNDFCDLESDRLNSLKCLRPLASGEVSCTGARAAALLSVLLSLVLGLLAGGWQAYVFLGLYGAVNLLYSLKLKHVPIMDIMLLVFGYLLRLIYGSYLAGISISRWMYLTVLSICFYVALGKRRNELRANGPAGRTVFGSRGYTYEFLDKNMYLFLGMAMVFYCLWAAAPENGSRLGGDYLLWTVPVMISICLRYDMLAERSQKADPVSILLKDRPLVLLLFVAGTAFLVLLYAPQL